MEFTTAKKAVTVKANNKTAYVGSKMPELDAKLLTITGLLGSDTVTGSPDDAGSNYTVSYENGVLNVTYMPDPAPVKKMKFEDVPEDKYYYEPVKWAFENNITEGITETIFGPKAVLKRAEVVTFLWRLLAK